MPNLVTVTGPVPPDQLGFTLKHEYIYADTMRVAPALRPRC